MRRRWEKVFRFAVAARPFRTVATTCAPLRPFSRLHLSATCPIGNLCRSVISHTENIRHRHVPMLPAAAACSGDRSAVELATVHGAATWPDRWRVVCVQCHEQLIRSYTRCSHRNLCVSRYTFVIPAFSPSASVYTLGTLRPRFISTG